MGRPCTLRPLPYWQDKPPYIEPTIRLQDARLLPQYAECRPSPLSLRTLGPVTRNFGGPT
jgi:hypothetical protein